MTDRMGETGDPWGTPVLRERGGDKKESTRRLHCLSERKDSVH